MYVFRGASEARRSRVISHPTNFAHVAHIGPEQTKPTLVDLSTVSGDLWSLVILYCS